jgi:hypothetical protein
MKAVPFAASVRALLGSLEVRLEDPAVLEILLVGPDRALISKAGRTEELASGVPKAKLAALVERLQKDPVALGDAFLVVLRSQPCGPLVRIIRRPRMTASLEDLAKADRIDVGARLVLEEALRDQESLLIAGRRATGKTEVLAAIASAWRPSARVVVIENEPRVLDRANVGHFSIDPDAGLEGAVALGADVIIADEPSPKLLFDLVLRGRPFAATIEAAGAASAILRLEARLFAADPSLSKGAVEALIESSVDVIVETTRDGERSRVKSVHEVGREDGVLTAQPATSWRRPVAPLSDATPAVAPMPYPEKLVPPAATTIAQKPVPIPSAVTTKPDAVVEVRKDSKRRPLSSPNLRSRTGSDAPPRRATPAPLERRGSPLALGHAAISAEPRPDASGIFPFHPSEVSEIRAEQLVSHSFVMNLSEIDPAHREASAPEVVAVDLPGMDEERTLDGQGSPALEPPVVERHPSVKVEVPETPSLAELVTRDQILLEEPSPSEDLVSPIEDALLGAYPSDDDDIKKVRREAQERMPTVINTPEPETSAPSLAEGPPTGQEIWSAAESDPLRVSDTSNGLDALVAPDDDPVRDLAATGDHAPSSHDFGSETHDLLLPAKSMEDEHFSGPSPIVSEDLDSTQAARLGEMVSGIRRSSGDEDRDFGSMATLNPEETDPQEGGETTEGAPKLDEPSPLRSRPFDEMTPVWPITGKDGEKEGGENNAQPPRSPSLDPSRAALATGEEFDALLEELRDVTHTSFDPDKESTEGGHSGDDPKSPGPKSKGRIVPSDIKRRNRLRGP